MVIFPAIDILNSQVVSLKNGDTNKCTVYSDNPIETALHWEDEGAEHLHIVDLNGALCGQPMNVDIIRDIIEVIDIPISLGGGLRALSDIRSVFNMGVAQVVLGTSAINKPEVLQSALKEFGEAICVSIDAKNNRVAIKGWVEMSDVSVLEFAQAVKDMGVKRVVCTDIARDGMLVGPNVVMLKEISNIGLDIICAGGIKSLDDIVKLKKIDIFGAIIGTAIYTGDILLPEAIDLQQELRQAK